MKKTTLILLTLFSVTISLPSYADWTRVGKNQSKSLYHVDFDTIRKEDGYVYYFQMVQFLKPIPILGFSNKAYVQGDCKNNRIKILQIRLYDEPMGEGVGRKMPNMEDNANQWMLMSEVRDYDSGYEVALKKVCHR